MQIATTAVTVVTVFLCTQKPSNFSFIDQQYILVVILISVFVFSCLVIMRVCFLGFGDFLVVFSLFNVQCFLFNFVILTSCVTSCLTSCLCMFSHLFSSTPVFHEFISSTCVQPPCSPCGFSPCAPLVFCQLLVCTSSSDLFMPFFPCGMVVFLEFSFSSVLDAFRFFFYLLLTQVITIILQ